MASPETPYNLRRRSIVRESYNSSSRAKSPSRTRTPSRTRSTAKTRPSSAAASPEKPKTVAVRRHTAPKPKRGSVDEVELPERSHFYQAFDTLLIVFFFFLLVIAVTIDYVNAVAPANTKITSASMKSWNWPPAAVREMALWWMENFDPLLQMNPLWLKVAAFFSPFVYGPFYLLAIYCIRYGLNWIRPYALMYAWGLFFTVTLIVFEVLYGIKAHLTPDPVTFLAAYGPYWLIAPVVVAWRFWSDKPFSSGVVQQ